MAGAGYKLFTTGSVLTASEVNTYLMEQTIMVFANATARDTALSGVLAQGMQCFLKDTNTMQYYSGAAWTTLSTGGDITSVVAGTGISGGGTSGDVTITNSMATTIDAKGDLIAGTANDTFARLAVGSNGDTLVADSAATTGLRWQGNQSAGKNAIINGGFDNWQRGTSFTGALGNIYGPDRWMITPTTARTFSRQSSGLTGIQYSLRCARNSSSTDTGGIYAIYSMESADAYRFAGQTVTLSYWAKAGANYSATSSALSISWQTGTGTDQNIYTAGYTGSVSALSTSVTLTTSWQRFTHTFSVGSTATEIGGWFTYNPTGTAGANDWFEVTGVQLELGSVATAFSRAGGTLAGELAACQRYYVRFAGTGSNTYGQLAMAFVRGTTTADTFFALPVRMRVAPTSFEYSTLAFREYTGTQRAISAATLDGGTTVDAGYVNFTIATSTAGYGGTINQSGSSSAYAAFSSEL